MGPRIINILGLAVLRFFGFLSANLRTGSFSTEITTQSSRQQRETEQRADRAAETSKAGEDDKRWSR